MAVGQKLFCTLVKTLKTKKPLKLTKPQGGLIPKKLPAAVLSNFAKWLWVKNTGYPQKYYWRKEKMKKNLLSRPRGFLRDPLRHKSRVNLIHLRTRRDLGDSHVVQSDVDLQLSRGCLNKGVSFPIKAMTWFGIFWPFFFETCWLGRSLYCVS